ncbi:MAG: NYN domain-containing protein [Synergistaceae bacterium]|nr:NYN domain-containing protein [Synergistaceae bacterium]
MSKVAVFLDYANIEAASRSMNYEVNYGALLNYLADETENRILQVAYAYVPIDPRLEHASDQKIEELWNSGYIVRSKIGSIAGNSYKCDFDIEMTLDIVRTSFDLKPDIVVIVSGDSDFVPVVLDLREKGIRVEVASFNNSMSNALSRRCSGQIILDVLFEDEDYYEDEQNPDEEENASNENFYDEQEEN